MIIHATSPDKKGSRDILDLLVSLDEGIFILDFVYQEAFLTTYRAFISPHDLIEKLIQRYAYFSLIPDKQKFARYAFSLMIRVIDEIE